MAPSRRKTRLASRCCVVLALAALNACGGGGGGSSTPAPPAPPPPPPPSASFAVSPATLDATFTAGDSVAVSFTLTPSSALTGTPVFVVSDTAGVVGTLVVSFPNSDGSYLVNLLTYESVTAGVHTGTITLKACSDSNCTTELPGSPLQLPFHFVASAPIVGVAVDPTTLTATFVANDPFAFTTIAVVNITGGMQRPLWFAAADPLNVFMPTVPVVSTIAGQQITLTLRASLPAGHYVGSLPLNVCIDPDCTIPSADSPISVPYDITVNPTPANAGLVTLSAWPGVSGWETFQRNAAHTGYVPATLDASKFATRWLWVPPPMLSAVTDPTMAVAANGLLYANSGLVLYALRESDGGVEWMKDLTSVVPPDGLIHYHYLNPPAVHGGLVYVATSGWEDTFMFGFDALTGVQKFKTPFLSQMVSYLAPTVDGGEVFADGGEYGGLVRFDATSGTQSPFVDLIQRYAWTPAVDASHIYSFLDSTMYVIDRTTGNILATPLDNSYTAFSYTAYSSPVIGSGSVAGVYADTKPDNAISVFDASTNMLRWSAPGHYAGNPAYRAGVYYAWSTAPLQLEARSESDGSLLWSWSPPADSAAMARPSEVLVTDSHAFVSTSTAVYAINLATHQSEWSMLHPGHLLISEDGVLYVTLVSDTGYPNGWILAVNLK